MVEQFFSFLGEVKSCDDSTGQLKFNCPNCDNGRNRHNLEVNYKKDVYNCWSCGGSNGGISGKNLYYLFRRFGATQLYESFRIQVPSYAFVTLEKPALELPQVQFFKFNGNKDEQAALTYLYGRGLTKEIIKKFFISYITEGEYSDRIFIPSVNAQRRVDYFVTRDYVGKTRVKYLTPSVSNTNVIFNQFHHDVLSPTILVEGAFDHIVAPNSIPILGKNISDTLLLYLEKYTKGDIYLALDADAQEKNVPSLLNRLFFGSIRHRLYNISPPDKDFSDIYKAGGKYAVDAVIAFNSKKIE